MATEAKTENEIWFLKKELVGKPDAAEHFEKKSAPMPDAAELKEGQVLLKSLFVSVDPYLRGRLREAKPGDKIVAGVCSEILESKAEKYPKGAFLHCYAPWARYNVVDTTEKGSFRLVDPKFAPLSTSNGVLGMPGMTAYFGLLKAGALKAGDRVLVSGAAGAVGSLVGQIAKLKGCYVVGTAGSEDKIKYLKEIGFDAALNYKELDTVEKATPALKDAFKGEGIDCYFDNTGGVITDAVFDLLNYEARIAVCGQIAHYNEFHTAPQHPRFLHKLIYKQATIRGFVVTHYMKDMAEFMADVPQWLKEGKIKYRETIYEGFDRIPEAFVGLFQGANIGKLQVKVA